MHAHLGFLLCLLTAAGGASAQSGMLSLHGQIVSYTCSVSANGGSTGDALIQLPKVASASLQNPGQRASATPFSIVVGSAAQPCMAASVAARWDGSGAGVDPDSGRLRNATGAGMAAGVQLAVLNNEKQEIDLRNGTNSQSVSLVGGMATLDYFGEYYGAGNLMEGKVSASTRYELDYR